MHKLLRRRKSEGFTLIELLVVVAIIAILAFVVITNLSSARAKARDAKISTDLSAIGNAAALMVANSTNASTITTTTSATDSSVSTALTQFLAIAQAPSNNLIPATSTVQHPLATANPPHFYIAAFAVSGTNLNAFRFCAQLEKPSDAAKPWLVNENGTVYANATNACNTQPSSI